MSIQTKIALSSIWKKIEKRGIKVGEKYKYDNCYDLFKNDRKIGCLNMNTGSPLFFINGKCYTTLRTCDKW